MITKSALVRRDVELLVALSAVADASVCLSICFSDDAMSRAVEPNTSPPSQRFQTLRILSEAGIRTAVGVAPVIPGLNDGQIVEILERGRSAGASSAFLLPIRLSGRTLDVFRERLEEAYPDRAPRVWNAIREIRGGAVNDTRFGLRLRGQGPRWDAIETLFRAQYRRLGFGGGREDLRQGTFRRPSPQGTLFG
jgi:DNA repair photolyase